MEKVESWECPLYLDSHVWVERLYLKTPNSKELVPCMLTHPTALLSNVTHMCGCGLKGYISDDTKQQGTIPCALCGKPRC
jgi:hypothetical protein